MVRSKCDMATSSLSFVASRMNPSLVRYGANCACPAADQPGDRSHAGTGIRFSIDDFGTGYSRLAYIRRLALHEIKIDHSFVKSIPPDADDTVIARTVTAMAKNVWLKVVS